VRLARVLSRVRSNVIFRDEVVFVGTQKCQGAVRTTPFLLNWGNSRFKTGKETSLCDIVSANQTLYAGSKPRRVRGSAMNSPRDNTKRNRWKLCFGVLILVVLVPLMIRDLMSDIGQGVKYYTDAPGMLLVAYALATAVGLAAIGEWYVGPRLPNRLQRQFVLWGWTSGNVLLMCLAGWMCSMLVESIMLEHAPFGRLIMENAKATNLKYLFGAILLALLAGTCISWWRLIRFSKARHTASKTA